MIRGSCLCGEVRFQMKEPSGHLAPLGSFIMGGDGAFEQSIDEIRVVLKAGKVQAHELEPLHRMSGDSNDVRT